MRCVVTSPSPSSSRLVRRFKFQFRSSFVLHSCLRDSWRKKFEEHSRNDVGREACCQAGIVYLRFSLGEAWWNIYIYIYIWDICEEGSHLSSARLLDNYLVVTRARWSGFGWLAEIKWGGGLYATPRPDVAVIKTGIIMKVGGGEVSTVNSPTIFTRNFRLPIVNVSSEDRRHVLN